MIYTGSDRRKAPRAELPRLMQDALQAARGVGGLWYWRGGYWLASKPDSWRVTDRHIGATA